MSLSLRLLTLAAVLALPAAGIASAQDAPFRSRTETFRIRRPPYAYFRYRIPSLENRVMPRIRLQQNQMRQRMLERSMERLDRSRLHRLELQDRGMRRSLELRERALERTRDRLERGFRIRPLVMRRHSRTI